MKADRITKSRWSLWLLTGVLAYGLFLLVLLPAALVWDQLAARGQVPVDVDVRGVSGTLWSGSAVAVILPNGLVVSPLTWRFRPVALAGGRLEWEVEGSPPGGHLSGRVSPGLAGIRLSRVRADLDTATTITPVPLLLSGRLIFDLEHVVLTRTGQVDEARGTIGWLDAGAGLPEVISLGHLRAELDATDQGALRLNIRDQGGPLIAEGIVEATLSGSYRVQGTTGTRPDADPRLGRALGMMGSAGPDGRIPVELSGSL